MTLLFWAPQFSIVPMFFISKVYPEQKIDLTPLLNDREKDVINTLCRHYQNIHRKNPKNDPNLFIFLGDNPTRKCWTGTSKKLPTFRRNSGKFWGVRHKRWLTPREKLSVLGFPVTPYAATAMGVPMLGMSDTRRAAHIAGNSMHFSSVGVVELVALCSFKLV